MLSYQTLPVLAVVRADVEQWTMSDGQAPQGRRYETYLFVLGRDSTTAETPIRHSAGEVRALLYSDATISARWCRYRRRANWDPLDAAQPNIERYCACVTSLRRPARHRWNGTRVLENSV